MHESHLKYRHTYFDDSTYILFLSKVCEFDKSFTLQATQVDQNGNSQRKKEFTALLKQVSSFDNGVKKIDLHIPKCYCLLRAVACLA